MSVISYQLSVKVSWVGTPSCRGAILGHTPQMLFMSRSKTFFPFLIFGQIHLFYLFPTPHSLLPTPYSLFPISDKYQNSDDEQNFQHSWPITRLQNKVIFILKNSKIWLQTPENKVNRYQENI